jgi:hypothetical protein
MDFSILHTTFMPQDPLPASLNYRSSAFKQLQLSLVYTKPPENPRKWPEGWKASSFKFLWRLWNTYILRTLGDACDEMNTLNPPGKRQVFATTTVKRDPATLLATRDAFKNTIASIKSAKIAGMAWTLFLQPLLPDWVHKGGANKASK